MRGRVSAVNSIFVGSSNELGAFESGLTAKLMGTVISSFLCEHDFINRSRNRVFLPSFRKLDLQNIDEHENSES
jgi:hypothetical protein